MSAFKEKDCIIEFAGLSLGEHTFELNVGNSFFERLDYSEINQGELNVKIKLLKRSNMMVLNFEIQGNVMILCDRCADEFPFPIDANHRLIVQIGGEDASGEDDDIITIGINEHNINLASYLYEYSVLSLPIKREHINERECNSTVINILNKYEVEEDPKEAKKETNDPRWDGLKDITLN